ncbi:MAG TPA: MBL fold metallo-hydrolase [Gemmatimonadaceae bacterium]|nr:MBL fold metallo-hydrolase [Gemmatimonadaceae bacterium]
MLALERYDDVTRLRFSTAASRSLGYDASAYAVRGLLIDTGFPDVGRDLAAWLDADRPRGVVVTHQHEDHAGNVELVASRGVPMRIAPETMRAVRAPARIELFRRFCWGSPTPMRSTAPPFDPAPLAFVASPGHCADHHVVWDAETATLFAGDLFLGVKVRVAQITEHIPALAQSLRDAIALAPERMFCAHRGLVPDPAGHLRAKLDWLEWLMGESARLHAMGRSDPEIARQLLGREGFLPIFTAGGLSKLNLIRVSR